MILEFSASNFKSIGEEVLFSTLCTADKSHLDQMLSYDRDENLYGNKAVVFGPNGSGKSTFFEALAFMRTTVLGSGYYLPGKKVLVPVNKLMGPKQPSKFFIQFVKDDIHYAYWFSVKDFLIDEEYLYAFSNGQQTKVFQRKGMQVVVGNDFRGRFENIIDSLQENQLLLSLASVTADVEETNAAYDFFATDLVFLSGYKSESICWSEFLWKLKDDETLKLRLLELLKASGLAVTDIEITEMTDNVDKNADKLCPCSHLTSLDSSAKAKFSVQFAYDRFSTDLFSEESAGTQKLFLFLCTLLNVLDEGKVFLCDDLDTSFHELLLQEIIHYFDNHSKQKNAQLIFSAHNISVLNLDLFRRDQIWFMELKPGIRQTDLYSLAEIKFVREYENIARNYLLGVYGAVPKSDVSI